jgi:hypothetical protein
MKKKVENRTNNIKKGILESGFPTEIEISSELRNDGWLTINQAPYFDPKADDFKFIDIFAMKEGVGLVTECKRSLGGHAWVFLTQSKQDPWIAAASAMHLIQEFLGQRKTRYPLNSHWLDSSIKVGSIFIDPFAKKDKQEKGSFLIALKQIQSEMTHFFIPQTLPTYPIIVYDGEIYECINKEIDLEPIEHLQYIHVQFKEGVVWPFLVDVVTLGYFPEFLKMINKEFQQP